MLDHDTILRRSTLSYSSDTLTGVTEHDRRVVKQIPSQRYLGLTPDQHQILKRFKEPKKVSEVLADLIRERKCPSLKNYYELILKAVDAGILHTGTEQEAREVNALSWPLKVGPQLTTCIAWAGILSAIICPLYFGLEVPDHTWELGTGIALTIFCAILGQVLAASHLRWAHGEIYGPHFIWASLVPRIAFDLSDAGLMNSTVRQRIALLEIAPQLCFLGIVTSFFPSLGYIAFTGAVLLTLPVAGSPMLYYLRARFDSQPLSTNRDFLFNPNRVFWNIFRLKPRPGRGRFIINNAIATAIWLLIVYCVNLRVFDLNATELFSRAYNEYRIVSILVLATVFVSMFLSGFSGLSLLLRNLRALYNRPSKRRRRIKIDGSHVNPKDHVAIAAFLKKCYIIDQLSLDDRTLLELAKSSQIVTYPSGSAIIEEGERGNDFYIILKGETEIIRTDISGRESISAELGSGEAFGEIALLENTERTRTVRAESKTTLIQIERDVFYNTLVSQVGRKQFEALLQKQAFLRRLPFTEDWPQEALRDFADNMDIVEHPRNTCMLKRGHDNRFFFIVYEGHFDVRVNKKQVGKIEPGEFVGEISLLQNSAAMADVVATEDSSCYAMDRQEFIKFISEDFIISMYFEKVSTQRLKRPLFPLNGVSLEAYRA
ncbi:MAG: cyclic nucleotide-binding domain-containing protein [Opitutales bacterium]